MLNRKVIVGIAVVILSFVGIFTFALNNDNSNNDPNDAVKDVSIEDKQEDKKDNSQTNNQDNEEENEEGVEQVVGRPTQTNTTTENTAPSITDVQLSTEDWTNGTVVLTIIANNATEYSIDNGNSWQTNNVFVVSSAGTYQVAVRNANDNRATTTVEVKIDTTGPVVTFETNGNSNYSKIASTKVTIVAEGAPVDPTSLKYVWTTSTEAPEAEAFEGGNIVLDTDNQIVISTDTDSRFATAPSGIYYLWVLAKDETGNGEPVRSEAFYLDNEAPVITLSDNDNPLRLEFKEVTSYTEPGVTVTDNSGEEITPVITNDINFNKMGTYTVTYTATDSSGNVATATRTVIIEDKKAPVVTVNPSNGSAYKKLYIVEVKATDANKVQKIKYLWTTTNEEPQVSSINKSLILNRTTTPLNANGTHYLWVYVEDNQGNSDVVLAGTYNLDNDAPNLSLKGDKTVTLNYGETFNDPGYEVNDNFDTNVKVSVLNPVNVNVAGVYLVVYTAVDDVGNTTIETRTVKVLPLLTVPNDRTVELGATFTPEKANLKISSGYTIKVSPKSNNVDTSKLGEYEVVYEYTYLGMKVTGKSRVTVIDTTNPTIILNKDGSNGYAKQHIVTVNASDYSGIKSLKYLWSKNNTGVLESEIVNEVVGPVSTIDGEDGIWYLWVYAEDNSGLKSIKVSEPYYLDNTAPKISQVIIDGNPLSNSYYERVEADKTKEYDPSKATVIGADLNGVPGDVTVEFVNCEVNMGVPSTSDTQYYCRYRLTDKQGNSQTQKRFIIVEDTTKPKITGFSVPWNYEIVEANKNATYIDTVEVYTRDNSSLPVTVYRLGCNVNMGVPGDYKCGYKTEDASGNIAWNDRFIKVVDTTAPTITGFSVPWNYETVEANKNATYIDTVEVYTRDNSSLPVTVHRLGCNVNMEIPGDYKCGYKTEDASGNIAWNDRFIKVVDTKAPTFTVSQTPEGPTNGDVILTINASDTGVGLHAKAYSFDNGETWGSSNQATFASNQIVKIKVRDAVENVSNTYSYEISNIDSAAPVVELSYRNDKTLGQTAVVTADENITISGWNCKNKTCEKTYTEKVNNQEVIVSDLFGNTTSVFVTITDVLELVSANFDYSTELKYFQSYNVIFNRDLILKNGSDYSYTYQYSTDGVNFLNSQFKPSIKAYDSANISNISDSFGVGVYPNIKYLNTRMLPITIKAGEVITRVETNPSSRLATIANLVKATTSTTAVYARIKITVSEDGQSKVFYTPIVKYSNFNGGVVGTVRVV